MSNAIFPSAIPGLSWDSVKTPTFSTRVQTSVSGKELRAAFYSYPIYDFHLQYEVLRDYIVNAQNEFQVIGGFFLARQGMFDSFLYTDPSDCQVTDCTFGIGDGTTKDFQLTRTYAGYAEPVMNVNSITNIKVAGTITGAYTVGATGIISFTTAPSAGQVLSWTGSYYFRCRFKQDSVDYTQFMNKLWSLKKLEFKGSIGNKV